MATEKRPKRRRSAGPGSAPHAGSRPTKTSSATRKKPRLDVRSAKKKGTTMTKAKRSRLLILLQSLMSHPYGVVFNNFQTLKDCRPESFKKLAKHIDLEIVKTMLDNDLYFTVEDFAEDVRTTFSNAMQIFLATDDVHKMAIKLRERFESGFKNKADSLNPEPKTCSPEPKKCNGADVYEKKEIHGEKTESPSRKRNSAAARSDKGKIYVGRPEIKTKENRVFVAGTHLVKGTEEKSFNFTVVPGATKKSNAPMTPRRAARIAAFMGKFDEREENKREKEFQVQEQRKREREALERMENTTQFGADHQALREFEWLLAHPEMTLADYSREEVSAEEMEEGEIPSPPQLLQGASFKIDRMCY